MIGVELKGMEKLTEKFRQMSELDRTRFFVEEFKPMADVIQRSMRAHAPVFKGEYWKSKKYASRNHPRGTLRDSIGKKIGGHSIPTVWISPNRKASRDAWYNHMVIGGHSYKDINVKKNDFVANTWNAIGGMVEKQLEQRFDSKLKAMLK